MIINKIVLNKEYIEKADKLISDAKEKADDAFEILKMYMTNPDEMLVYEGQDIAGELRGAILTLDGVDTLLMEILEKIEKP